MSESLKKNVCPYDCPTSCGFWAVIEDGKLKGVKPDENHPASQGIMCRKMRNYELSVNSPDRILTPLLRTGEKGEGKFKAVKWDEALDIISTRWKNIIAENGPESIAYCYYSGVMSDIQRNCGEAFFNRMGALGLVKTLCSTAKGVGYASVMGKTGCLDPREIGNGDLYIVWGSNMAATRIQSMPDIIKAKKEGKRVILIEVYAEAMKKYCDETVLIKPGTDGALALAMMHVLIREGLADEEFLRENTYGYDEFKETLPEYTPLWAEKITGVPKKVIESLALEYGRAKSPVIILGSGNSRYGNGAMTVRLITILSHFTGAWLRDGGLCGCTPVDRSYVNGDIIKRPDFRKSPAKEININQLGAAVKDENVKSLYVYASNPVNSVSDTNAIIEGLKREDIFTVVHERFMTDTAKYADIILPATFSVEQSDIYEAYGYCTLATARKLIEPAGESKSDWDTFRLLAEKMGYDDEYFKLTEDEMLDLVLDNPTDAVKELSSEERNILKEGGWVNMPFSDHHVWKTKTGKIQIINESDSERVPRYTECHGGEYPISLVSVPSEYTLNSIFNERDDMKNARGEMKICINTEDALERGIKNGDDVICYNDIGSVKFKAEVTDNVAKGAAAAVGIYGHRNFEGGLGVNALQHDRLSDRGAATTMNDNTIDIKLA